MNISEILHKAFTTAPKAFGKNMQNLSEELLKLKLAAKAKRLESFFNNDRLAGTGWKFVDKLSGHASNAADYIGSAFEKHPHAALGVTGAGTVGAGATIKGIASLLGGHEKKAGIETLLANYAPEALAGALVGGGVGALTSKKKRLRNILLRMLGGAGAGVGARYALAGKTIGVANRAGDLTGAPVAIRVPYNKGGWKADHLPGAKVGIQKVHEAMDRLEKAKSQKKVKITVGKKPAAASDKKEDGQTKSAAPIALIGNVASHAMGKGKPRAWMDILRSVGSRVRDKGARYLELMRGGNDKIVGQYRAGLKAIDDLAARYFKAGDMKNYHRAMKFRAMFSDAAWTGRRYNFKRPINIGDRVPGFGGDKALTDELGKVLKARAGTAGVVGGAGITIAGMRPRPASNYLPQQQGYYGQGGIYGSDNPLSM